MSVVVWKLREETAFSENLTDSAVRLSKARTGTLSLALAVQRSLMTLIRRVEEAGARLEEAVELTLRKWRGQV